MAHPLKKTYSGPVIDNVLHIGHFCTFVSKENVKNEKSYSPNKLFKMLNKHLRVLLMGS
jgi:hypothetical protein